MIGKAGAKLSKAALDKLHRQLGKVKEPSTKMIKGYESGKGRRGGAKAPEQARKIKGKEAADVTVPSDVVRREGVLGERAAKASTPPPQRAALISGTASQQRAGWASKKRTLDRLDNELTTKESRIDALRKQSKEAEDPKTRMRLTTQIQKLQARIKSIKELMALERKGMTGMRQRQGPAVQVKTGGTVKRSKGCLIGMGAALRGGGSVRRI